MNECTFRLRRESKKNRFAACFCCNLGMNAGSVWTWRRECAEILTLPLVFYVPLVTHSALLTIRVVRETRSAPSDDLHPLFDKTTPQSLEANTVIQQRTAHNVRFPFNDADKVYNGAGDGAIQHHPVILVQTHHNSILFSLKTDECTPAAYVRPE